MAALKESPNIPVKRVGLTLLSDPLEAVIDIVFVHGLQGHPQETWTLDSKSARKSSAQVLSSSSKVSENDKARTRGLRRLWSKSKHTDPGRSDKEVEGDKADDNKEEAQGKAVFWPNDLKEDFPQARVMMFGYDTDITHGYHSAHQGTIFSHARDLLYNLEAKRRNAAERDLVFIAHSLGGILVKEVLRRSESDPDLKIKRIFTSTTGVFFFGTPHRGSKDWASFGEGVATVAGRLLGVDTNDKVIHALSTGPELELCRESFIVQWGQRGESLMVRTFQESKGITGVRWGGFNQLVVPPESSTLDHPNQRARTINADHINMVKFSGKDDENYEMVRADIEELVIIAGKVTGKVVPEDEVRWTSEEFERQQRSRTAVGQTIGSANGLLPMPSYYLPLPRNHHFVGRSTILGDLKQKLLVSKECQKMVLVGLGGIGKTQVALQFALSAKKELPRHSIFWLPALSLESFEQACVEIARILQIPQTVEGKDDIKELVRQQLNARTTGKWLLIVDNADSISVLFGNKSSKGVVDYLPESEDGLILFTSRHHEVAQSLTGSDVLELKKMSDKEAESLLKKSVRKALLIYDAMIMTDLLIELDYLPLAITQAAAYINTKNTSISEYLRLLKNTTDDVISLMSEEFRDNTRYKDSANAVATTWVMSFNQILEHDAAAADLLGFMSCIEWKAIPLSILPVLRPEARMMSAIGTILSYSFAVQRDNENAYDMHRLVHLATRIWIRQHGRATETSKKAMVHLAQVFPSSDYENREIWREYLPHAVRLSKIEQLENMKESYSLFLKVGKCLRKDGRTRESVVWLERSYLWRKNNLLETDSQRLSSQHELASAYRANGQVKEAVALLEQVVKIQEATLATDHPSRLASQHALASAYRANGQVQEAVALLKQVVEIREATLATDHPDRVISEQALAYILQEV